MTSNRQERQARLERAEQGDVLKDKRFWVVSIVLWVWCALGVCALMVMLGNLDLPDTRTTLDFSTPGRYMILAGLVVMLTALYSIGKVMVRNFPWLREDGRNEHTGESG